MPLVRICAGGIRQPISLPRPEQGPPCREIVCNGGSHFGRQRHLCNPLSFAAYRDQTGFPIEVVQREGNHFAISNPPAAQRKAKVKTSRDLAESAALGIGATLSRPGS